MSEVRKRKRERKKERNLASTLYLNKEKEFIFSRYIHMRRDCFRAFC